MATFGTATFGERGEGGGRGFAGMAARAEVAQTIIPEGATFVQIISNATGFASFDVPCQGSAAQLETLRGLVGASETLVFAGGTVGARLVSVANVVKVLDDLDIWQWTCNFLG